ncbi:alanine racemase [Candidatus Acetothermia bacterium]|jgi:alanine racemase|nr:alanine racemase [Candidatus Acetothermia bacterium]MCI2432619.1 alanine racemase [Candidatus Acetothermia bacterium]MCI2435946.1 alanine racemase [Candidatus Acetothermia bacterium]
MAEALIDLKQLERNIATVRAHLSPDVKILFPVKADAYGHGAVEIARTAERVGIDYLGVANIGEALELRAAGIQILILTLAASRIEHIPELLSIDLDISLSSLDFARALNTEAVRQAKRAKVQIKVDTGMGRNGALPKEALQICRALQKMPGLQVTGIFSHFASSYSEDPDDQAFTRRQIVIFNDLLAQLDREKLLPPLRHIANSSGLVQYEREVTTGYYNMVRPGILFYGYPEVRRPWVEPIKPILRMRSWIVTVNELPPGSFIGYGRRFQTKRRSKIVTVPVGYADGVIWLLANIGEVLIHGKRAPIVGAISMDQITVDVTEIPEAKLGDEVELIGPQMTAEEIARKIGANFSEVVLTALSKRVARVYF